MSKRKPHNEDAGYICERRHWLHRGWVTVYRAAEQGIDAAGHMYAVVCQDHGCIVGETSVARARVAMRYPENFCETCAEAVGAVRAQL